MSGKTQPILQEVAQERLKQDAKWGIQNHFNKPLLSDLGLNSWFIKEAEISKLRNNEESKRRETNWTNILLEEVYEALAESNTKRLREELIQVAGVSVAWIEAIDRRTSNEKTKILSN